MHAAEIVEILGLKDDFFARETVAKTRWRRALLDDAIEERPVHGAVQIGQTLGPLADKFANLVALFQRQRKALKQLRAVDRVKQARMANPSRATRRFQETLDGQQMAQVCLLCVAHRVYAEIQQ